MDSIGDMLAAIMNASGVRKENVDIPHSRMKEEIVKILLAEGFIGKFEVISRGNRKYLRLALKYTGDKKSIIEGLKRVSKLGCRTYVGAKRIPRVRSGFGTTIISTCKGLMTGEEAREKKLGGEVICHVW